MITTKHYADTDPTVDCSFPRFYTVFISFMVMSDQKTIACGQIHESSAVGSQQISVAHTHSGGFIDIGIADIVHDDAIDVGF